MTKVRSYSFLTVLLLVMVAVLGTSSPTLAASPGDIVINEIMQNPAAVDDSAGEWFELYNPTGADIDIDGWTISDEGIDAHTISNGGPLIVPAGGYLVLGNNDDSATNGGVSVAYSYGSNWFLANGDDEVVLVDSDSVEIDRVEYDGGPSFPDPTGASMALSDPALDNNDGANWCTATTPYGEGDLGTPGAANDCDGDGGNGAGPGDVVVNEIMQNPAAVGDGEGEWLELYNATDSDIDIDGWTIADNDSDSHVINNGGPLVIPAGGYLVLGNNDDTGTNGGVNVDYDYGSSWFLANGADEVVLSDSASTEIDRVEYDGGATFPDPNGASMALVDPALDNNDGANWCTASTPYGAGDFGTPGAANDCDGDGGNGAEPGDVVVNEIMQNPSAVFDSAGEWLELYNATDADIDINGWTLADNDFDSHVIDNGGSLVIPAGGYLVLGNNGDAGTNGGVTVDYVYSGFTLANGADEVVLRDSDGAEIDRVEYDGGATFPDPNGASMALSDPELDNNDGANWCTSSTPYGDGDLGTPGAANDCGGNGGGEIGQCTDPVTHFIHEVQGDGLSSPIIGTTVEVQGVVVGDYQNNGQPDNGDLEGFFLQEEDADADGNPATSEGVFVFDGPSPALDVEVGDVVRVLGSVSEFFGRTEISLSEAVHCSSGATVTPAQPSLPVDNVDDLEAYEGMSVLFTQDLYISEYFNFDRFGEIVLTAERQFQPTAVFEPGSADAADLADLNSRSRITLDDGRDVQNPDPALHPDGDVFDLDNLFRGGDIVRNLPGVMDFGFGLYRIQPTTGGEHIVDNPRPEAPEDVGGDIQVASFNVLNYFTTIDEGPDICGPQGDLECRGADTPEELTRQRDKIIAAIAGMDADVVGLIEIQNDAGESTADLVAGLNDLLGDGTYDYIDTGFIGTDAIKQAFIYQPAEVTPVGAYAVLDTEEFVDPNDTGEPKNRPALAQSFEDNDSGGVFTAVVNHLKSKGSPCGPGDDDPEQGSCNLTRTLSAQILADWLASDPTDSGDADFLIIGDLNAYDKEDPIDALISYGYTDLVNQYQAEFAYSFVFDGQLGYLDHALANPNLLPQITGTTVWHINADEPDILDYDMSFKQDAQDALYEPNAYRSSDHDPVIVGLDLNGSPVCDDAAPSVSMLWTPNHMFHSIDIEGVTDPEGDPITINIDGIFQDEAVDAPDSGNTAPDGQGVGTPTAEVRAERVGTGGNGRVYHIFFTATDSFGGSCSGEVLVSVPVSVDMTAIDDGALFDSTATP